MDYEFLPPTQLLEEDPPVPTPREYDQVVLFSWRKGNKEPFKIYERQRFSSSEIKDDWYKFQMKANSRMKRLRGLKSFDPFSMSMFAKVETSRFTDNTETKPNYMGVTNFDGK